MSHPDWRQRLADECRAFAQALKEANWFAGSAGLRTLHGEARRLESWRTTLSDRDSRSAAWFDRYIAHPLAELRKMPMAGLGADAQLPDPNAYPNGTPEGEIETILNRQRQEHAVRAAKVEAHAEKLRAPFLQIIRKLEAFADLCPIGQIPPEECPSMAMEGEGGEASQAKHRTPIQRKVDAILAQPLYCDIRRDKPNAPPRREHVAAALVARLKANGCSATVGTVIKALAGWSLKDAERVPSQTGNGPMRWRITAKRGTKKE
jgi:hypothetical protein